MSVGFVEYVWRSGFMCRIQEIPVARVPGQPMPVALSAVVQSTHGETEASGASRNTVNTVAPTRCATQTPDASDDRAGASGARG